MGMIGSMQYADGAPVPVYGFFAYQRPTYKSRAGKVAYCAAVQEAARREIDRPIEAHDVEVEILYVTREPRRAIDVDGLGKPTLDALKGVAYIDDNQVRAIRIAKFDKTRPAHLSGRIGPIRALWQDDYDLEQLGGDIFIEQQQFTPRPLTRCCFGHMLWRILRPASSITMNCPAPREEDHTYEDQTMEAHLLLRPRLG